MALPSVAVPKLFKHQDTSGILLQLVFSLCAAVFLKLHAANQISNGQSEAFLSKSTNLLSEDN